MTPIWSPRSMLQSFLIGVLAFAPIGFACAWPTNVQPATRPQLVAPAPGVQFQQTVQQQQVRDQLQKSQLEQQLRQSVSDNAKRPNANDPRMLRQLDLAGRAQRDRDRAAQQDVVDRYRDRATLPQIVPQAVPASSRSGG